MAAKTQSDGAANRFGKAEFDKASQRVRLIQAALATKAMEVQRTKPAAAFYHLDVLTELDPFDSGRLRRSSMPFLANLLLDSGARGTAGA